MKKVLFIGVVFLLTPCLMFAQNELNNLAFIETIAEELVTQNDLGADVSDVLENLLFLAEHPVELNKAKEKELEKLIMLNEFQIKALLNYKDKYGPLVSLYDLQLIDGFDSQSIKQLSPFVSFNLKVKETPKRASFKHYPHQLLFRGQGLTETPLAYQSSLSEKAPYQGSKYRIYTRYAYRYPNFMRWGFTAEKDPGETFTFSKDKYGFDYLSAHMQIKTKGLFNQVNIGDYKVRLGQGLVVWSGVAYDKSLQVMNIRKRNGGLSPHTSTDENNFFRGLSTVLAYNNMEILLFASYKNIDANLQISDSVTHYTSLPNTGIHASESQINQRKNLSESVMGGAFTYKKNNYKLGINALTYALEYEKAPAENPYAYYSTNGKTNTNLSADFQLMYNRVLLFSEAAADKNANLAFLGGLLFKFNAQLNVSLLYRHYSKAYVAPFAQGFAEGSHTQNEEGFYLGALFHPYKNWKISAYYDFYRFPWFTYNASGPSKGSDYKIQIDYLINNKLNAYLRFSNKSKEENQNTSLLEGTLPTLVEKQVKHLRFHLNTSLNNGWSLRNRVELSQYNKLGSDKEQGYLIYQDVIYNAQKQPLKLILRYALFDTDSYSSRIYTYENDVLNAYAVPALFQQGSRWYVLLNYSFTKNATFWFKVSRTTHLHASTMGSGVNLIESPHKTELKIQLRLKI